MCKKINRFFPCLLGFYFAASILIGKLLNLIDSDLPYWMACIISELLLLIPVIVYIAVNKINVLACIPYRKLRWQDALMSLLAGYLLIPVITAINAVSSLFATNYLQESAPEFTTYPFVIQVLLIAVLPALVEEFVFRGVIYHSYRKNGLVGAMLFSAIAFGVVHMNLNQFLYAVVIGMFFAKMVEVTGSMWSSVLAHFAVNTYSISMVQIMKMAGIDVFAVSQSAQTQSDSLSQLAEQFGSSDAALAAGKVMELFLAVVSIVSLIMVAVIFGMLATLLINHMAKKNGRYDYYRYYTKMGLKPMNNENFVTVPYAVTVILAFIYMVVIEVMQYL